MGKVSRGVFIVVEGCDRSGKTTVCKSLVSTMQNRSIPAKYMNFPDRSTLIGEMINKYLMSKVELPDEAIHLLFSANRWELASAIKSQLEEGISLVVDRYAFSGAAFTASKGLQLDWCMSTDIGLPKPDKVILLTLSPEAQAARKGFGSERYEVSSFQTKVMENFLLLKDPSWEEVDADRCQEELHDILLKKILSLKEGKNLGTIGDLWK